MPPFRKGLIVTLGLVISLAVVMEYNMLLNLQLAGYRGRKLHQLEMIKRRDARRRYISDIPAVRDRILREEFGDLPEAVTVRTQLELVGTWQLLLAIMFLPLCAGVSLYITLGRRKRLLIRCLRGLAVLAGTSQALPLMLLPGDALRFVRMIGIPLVIASLLVLAAGAVSDRLAELRQKTTA